VRVSSSSVSSFKEAALFIDTSRQDEAVGNWSSGLLVNWSVLAQPTLYSETRKLVEKVGVDTIPDLGEIPFRGAPEPTSVRLASTCFCFTRSLLFEAIVEQSGHFRGHIKRY
jgi:hypothetical protein